MDRSQHKRELATGEPLPTSDSRSKAAAIDDAGHVALGIAAFSSGLLDVRALAESMLEVGRRASEGASPEVWLGSGRLTISELSTLLASLGCPASGRVRIGLDDEEPYAPTLLGIKSEAFALDAKSPDDAANRDLGDASEDSSRSLSLDDRERYADAVFLNAGGMSRLFACTDSRLTRRVALKTVRSDFRDDPRAKEMLRREARLTAVLEHPNIIPIYDAGERDDVGPFYTMRHFDQPSLAMVVAAIKAGETTASETYGFGRRLRCFIQICNAIEYAHDRGIVHCDLKPANILLGSFGEVLVADWGIAQRNDEISGQLKGTPGYMAPEQYEVGRRVDERTDVFALGAILYELVCLEPAFDDDAIERTFALAGRGLPPPKPRPLAEREGAISAELAAICERALEFNPNDRYPSVREMAAALETFLEGTRERERRRTRADQLTEEGDALARNYRDLIASRPDRVAELEAVRTTVLAWEGADQKRVIWDAEDRLRVTDALAVRTLQAAVTSYEQALGEVSSHRGARRGLALLYWGEMLSALQRRDEFNRVYFEELVRQYDDGTIPEVRRSEGYLSLASRPFDARISIWLLEERDHRLEPRGEPQALRTPIHRLPLTPGSYFAVLSGGGLPDVKYPLLIRPGIEVDLVVDLDMLTEVDDDEIFVPGAPALVGHHEPNADGRELRTVLVQAFIIAERPVSFGEYLEFLTEAWTEDRALAERWFPCGADGSPLWEWNGREFAATRIMTRGEARALPAFGIDFDSAQAYIAWKSKRSGRLYRLPTEAEWEKAARGTDGRRYPWGDHFDPSFCKMRESRAGLAMPEPSGSFPFDVSPYGVRDMAGGVADWVIPGGREEANRSGAQQVASRGGAWCDWAADCAIGSRRLYAPSERSARVGFRLARTPEPGR